MCSYKYMKKMICFSLNFFGTNVHTYFIRDKCSLFSLYLLFPSYLLAVASGKHFHCKLHGSKNKKKYVNKNTNNGKKQETMAYVGLFINFVKLTQKQN